MRDFFARRPYLSAVALGVLFAYVGLSIWGLYFAYVWVDLWLLTTLALNGHTVAYNIASYSHELVVTVLIALPFAYFLSRIRPERSWKYVWVALAVIFAVVLWRFLAAPPDPDTALRAWFLLETTLLMTAAFVLAYLIVGKLRHREDAD